MCKIHLYNNYTQLKKAFCFLFENYPFFNFSDLTGTPQNELA